MNLPQKLSPEIDQLKPSGSEQLHNLLATPIALMGCGLASISCATFLARLGQNNLHIFEGNSFGGGSSLRFRRGLNNIRAAPEVMGLVVEEKCKFIPFVAPKMIMMSEDQVRIRGMDFYRAELVNDSLNQIAINEERIIRLRADYLISAFGSQIDDEDLLEALRPIELNSQTDTPKIDHQTMICSLASIFCGGDLSGITETTVKAVNNGKTAA